MTGMVWVLYDKRTSMEMLGFLPLFFQEDDPRSAVEQLNERYAHGGGWHPFPGFQMGPDDALLYPGDPPTKKLGETILHEKERIIFYQHSWLVIMQPDGTWECSRVD